MNPRPLARVQLFRPALIPSKPHYFPAFPGLMNNPGQADS